MARRAVARATCAAGARPDRLSRESVICSPSLNARSGSFCRLDIGHLTTRHVTSMADLVPNDPLVQGAQEVSQEMFGLVQEQLTKRVDGLNRIAGCRSVRAFVAAQSELMRDNVQLVIDTNRRIAALSVRIADEAAGALSAQADDPPAHVHRAV